MNFTTYGESYIQRKSYKLADSTKETYEQYLKTLDPIIGDKDVSEILPMDVDTAASELYKKLSPGRAKCTGSFLVAVLNDAKRNKQTDCEFAFEAMRVQQKETPDPLTIKEVERAIAHADKHYQPLLYFLAMTGCRPSEAFALRWEDLDLISGEAIIQKGRVRGKEKGTKTLKLRKVPLPHRLREILRKLSVNNKFEYLFVSKHGLPMDRNLDRVWKRACENADIPFQKVYSLRHAFATNALVSGASLPYISQILGHSTVEMTARHYAKTLKKCDKSREALDRMFQERH